MKPNPLLKGQRMLMTCEALKAKIHGRGTIMECGTFQGYSSDYSASRLIWVTRDGKKKAERYHESFWEPA